MKNMSASKLSCWAAIVLGGLAAFGSEAKAADEPAGAAPPAPERRGARPGLLQERMSRIAEALNLTDEQKAKTKAVFQEETRKLRQLRQDKELSREDKVAKVREIRRSIEGQLKPILSADQWEK